MTTRISSLMAIVLVGCNTGFDSLKGKQLEKDVADLKAQVQALKTDNQSLRSQLTTLADQLSTAEPTLAAAEELSAVVSVDADGDVVISDANLWVQNGTANTAGTPNGKGNIYVGYNEQGRCNGGTTPGAPCGDGISICGGGTCEPGDGSQSTGSHNVIIGSWTEHSSYAGLGVGRSNALNAPQCTAVGAGNTCAAREAFVAGRANTATGDSCSVLGGAGGTCSGLESVVVGGFQNNATVDQSIVP